MKSTGDVAVASPIGDKFLESRSLPGSEKGTSTNPTPFDGAISIAFALRSAKRLSKAQRRSLAKTLKHLDPPDTAAGQLVAEWLLRC